MNLQNSNFLRRVSLVVWLGYIIGTVALSLVLLGTASADRYNVNYHWTAMRSIKHIYVSQVGGVPVQTELPARIGPVKAGETYIVTFTALTSTHDAILFKASGMSLKVYINDRLYLSTGQENTYPGFQMVPAPDVRIDSLPSEQGIKYFRAECTVAGDIGYLEIPKIYVGDSSVLVLQLINYSGLPLLLACLVLLAGVSLIGMAPLASKATPSALAFIWLGISCLGFGIWNVSINDLALYLVPYNSLLYTLSFMGMLVVVSPLAMFYRMILEDSGSLVLRSISALASLVWLATVLLHLLGIWPFVYSVSYIRVFIPIALIIMSANVFYEYWRWRRDEARMLMVPTFVLAAFSLADIVDVTVLAGSYGTRILLFGFAVFTAIIILLGSRYIDSAFEKARQSEQMSIEIDALQSNLEKQRDLYQRLSESSEQVRAMRHDMRHQLSALRGYLEADDKEGALSYIEQIDPSNIDFGQMMLTDNFTVNAVVNHYLAMANDNKIHTDLALVVPSELGRVSESDMSIIFGNLFENAIEACLYLPEEKRLIRMRSQLIHKNLTLVIDNTFDGFYDARDGVFYSRKRTGKGIGLTSVRNIVDRYDGSMKVEAANGVFQVSVMVRL